MAEKLLLPLIKRFVSESSSKEDSVSSRCSKDPEGHRSSIFKGRKGIATIFGISAAEAGPSEAAIRTVLWDFEAQIKDSWWACLEVFVHQRGLSQWQLGQLGLISL